MVARIWSEVGKTEMLNCVRPLINAATGLDFNLPTTGPLADVAIEWNFEGDNQTRVNDAATRNTEKFVVFEVDMQRLLVRSDKLDWIRERFIRHNDELNFTVGVET